MPLSVSSSFDYQRQQPAPSQLSRQLMIGTSDYTDRVTKWPSFKYTWDDLRPQSASVSLANEDNALTVFRDNTLTFTNSCRARIAINGEPLDVFVGTIGQATYGQGGVTLRMVDKVDRLARRVIGSTASPVVYSGGWQVHSIAWGIAVTYGGFSNVASTSNPDIDYAAFKDWSAVFSTSGALMDARYEGTNVLDALRKVSRMTNSAIVLRDNKLYFKRFTLADSSTLNLDASIITAPGTLEVTNDSMVNRMHTFAGYRVDSNYWTIDAVDANSASVNSYGVFERVEQDTTIWYTNSVSALDLSQRIVTTYKAPVLKLKTQASLPAVLHMVGEMISVTDPSLGVSGDTYRTLGIKFDMDKLTIDIDGDQSQIFGGFTLDTSSLDGSDVLL